jgi:hypothetical protein
VGSVGTRAWVMLFTGRDAGDPLFLQAKQAQRLAAYMGAGDVFDRALADFAAAYVEPNKRDYVALHEAVEAGRVVAQKGV